MNKKNIALVTGASSGIGEALSRELVKRGWSVIGLARSLDKLTNIQNELGSAFTPVVCDVSVNIRSWPRPVIRKAIPRRNISA